MELHLCTWLRHFDVGTKFDSNCGSNQRSLVELSCFAFLQFDIFQWNILPIGINIALYILLNLVLIHSDFSLMQIYFTLTSLQFSILWFHWRPWDPTSLYVDIRFWNEPWMINSWLEKNKKKMWHLFSRKCSTTTTPVSLPGYCNKSDENVQPAMYSERFQI